MKIRVITSVIALAVFIAVLLAPPIVFTIALAGVILVMLYECYSATKTNTAMKTVGFISGILLMTAVYSVQTEIWGVKSLLASIMAIIMLFMILIIIEHGKRSYKGIMATGFLTFYIVLATGCIWLMKERFGISGMLLIFICAWGTDTFAYLTGKAFGKHKLIPHVSPNKTVEGSIGGVIGAVLLCVLYLAITSNLMSIQILTGNIYIQGIIIGLIGSVFSQLGDLTASSIKRDTGIKDFGWIFPGHGGFMDRFDSVIFISPFLFGILTLMTHLF